MNLGNWQTPVALIVVLAATVYLVRSALAKRRKPGVGCGGDCGCPTKEFKRELTKRTG